MCVHTCLFFGDRVGKGEALVGECRELLYGTFVGGEDTFDRLYHIVVATFQDELQHTTFLFGVETTEELEVSELLLTLVHRIFGRQTGHFRRGRDDVV